MLDNPSLFSLDYGSGGLGDIHSIVTCGVLYLAAEQPELTEDVETMSLLHDLVAAGFVTMDEYRALQRAYMKYREKLHVLDLQHVDHLVSNDEVEELRPGVEQVYARVFAE